MIDMRHKPRFLPQVSAPFEIILQKLTEENIEYNILEVNPDDLVASQGIVYSDEVNEVKLDDNNPIWIANENKICDGHHRWIKALSENKPLKAIQIKLNCNDAYRVLNKIQDIYDYEQQQQLEEVITQDVINTDNQTNSGISDSEFLASLEEDNTTIQTEKPEKNQKTIIGYRKEPIKENSVVGNFFVLNPIDGFSKYEINFDNLLDTNDLGLTYKDSQIPVDIIAKIWFPNINFEKISEQYKMPSINLKNRAIAEKAMKLGFDGIKYGDKLIQGLK